MTSSLKLLISLVFVSSSSPPTHPTSIPSKKLSPVFHSASSRLLQSDEGGWNSIRHVQGPGYHHQQRRRGIFCTCWIFLAFFCCSTIVLSVRLSRFWAWGPQSNSCLVFGLRATIFIALATSDWQWVMKDMLTTRDLTMRQRTKENDFWDYIATDHLSIASRNSAISPKCNPIPLASSIMRKRRMRARS